MTAPRSADAPPAGTGLDAAEHALASALFEELFDELASIGRAEDDSSTRLAWTDAAAAAARWFDGAGTRLGLAVEVDRNGNRWAWSAPPQAGSLVTGSHLDTVPAGGRFDGALGVVAGLVAVHILGARAQSMTPLAVVSFADEEGGRYNTPTFGSRLMVGALDPHDVLARTDAGGVTLEQALREAGLAPEHLGRDEAALARIGAFVELHIEQGHLLHELELPLGVATSILPHGRWRMDFVGQANHGGTTTIADRRDPMLALAEAVLSARRAAQAEQALVTVGRVEVRPNAANGIAERVSAWLDIRSAEDRGLDRVLERVTAEVSAAAAAQGVTVDVTCESRVGAVVFSEQLLEHTRGTLAALDLQAVSMDTAAGHDAGALAAEIPTAMLFVRNQTGVSHAPAEAATVADCVTGIGALVAVLDGLAGLQLDGRRADG